jgi:glucose-6-phosphate isomerase
MKTAKAKSQKKAPVKFISYSEAWKALAAHQKQIAKMHLRDLFGKDPKRGEKLTASAAGLFLDYSKNRVTGQTLKLLTKLARQAGLRAKIDAMFRGEKINATEGRAVLHVALRAPRNATLTVDGKNVVPEVHAVLDKMAGFSNRIRSGAWTGHTGRPSRMSSTSALADLTWDPSWRTRRSGITAIAG